MRRSFTNTRGGGCFIIIIFPLFRTPVNLRTYKALFQRPDFVSVWETIQIHAHSADCTNLHLLGIFELFLFPF